MTAYAVEDKDKVARFFEALQAGNYPSVAAVYAGLTRSQVREWVRKGNEDPTGRYGEFARAYEQQQAFAEVRLVNLVNQAAHGTERIDSSGKKLGKPGDWRASHAILKRRFHQRWGEQTKALRVEANVQAQTEAEVNVSVDAGFDLSALDHLTEAELDQMEALMEAARQRAQQE